MRVRRRFWILLGGTILFVLSLPLFSLPAAPQAPAPLHVEVYREPSTAQGSAVSLSNPPVLLVQLTDANGLLVDHANLQTVASMPAMAHLPLYLSSKQVGHGLYMLDLSFSMPGYWSVRLDARAPDHQQASQTLTFVVQGAQQTSEQGIMIEV